MIQQYLSKCLTLLPCWDLRSVYPRAQIGIKPEERTRWKDSTGRDWTPFKAASTDGKGGKTWRRVSQVRDKCPQTAILAIHGLLGVHQKIQTGDGAH
jgi:hypothetical protein